VDPTGFSRPGFLPRSGATHPRAAWLVPAGAIAATVAMVAEGRLGPRDPHASDPSSWWGILPSVTPADTTRGVLAGTAALAVIALCACWWLLVRRALAGRVCPRLAVTAALTWSVPFALGPPLFSRDVYAYAAQGELARRGLDPATHGISTLRSFGGVGAIFVAAVDPRWRETHAPYGGTAVAVEKVAATLGAGFGTGPTGAGILLKVVAVLAVVVGVLLAPGLLPPRLVDGYRRTLVLALLAANPVLIIHLVGGAHLDAIAGTLLVGALVLDRRRSTSDAVGGAGRDRLLGTAAVGLACLAGTLKATAFLGLAWLMLAHGRDAVRPGRARAAAAGVLAADLAATGAVLALSMLASGFGPTWVGALPTSGKLETGVAPASILAGLVTVPLGVVGLHPPGGPSAVLTAARALTLAAAGTVIVVLLLRELRRRGVAGRRTVAGGAGADGVDGMVGDLVVFGYGGMAVALGSPVLYPWYLALSLPALAVLIAGRARPATSPLRDVRATWTLVAVASSWLCVATLSPLAATWRLIGRAGPVALAVLAVAGVALSAIARTASGRLRVGSRTP
jgi:alpha-1,6-mannosyltransferase